MARIAIVSASLGAGHDRTAQEIARRLRENGHTADVYDSLDYLPFGFGRKAKEAYRRQLDVAPWSWEWLLSRLANGGLLAALVIRLCSSAGRSLRMAMGPIDAVVSTYPLASQVLARQRQQRKLDVPLITYLTDPSVHPLWIAAGTDLYLAAHPEIARQVRKFGASNIEIVGPAVRPEFRPVSDADERAKARTEFGLPHNELLALVVSGSWAVGEIEQSAREIAALGIATPVVVCGENEALRGRLADLSSGIVLGWVDDMPTLLRACDVVVLNSGGLTFFEAHATGLPVLTYRCLAGHGRTNAQSLETAGLARWLHSSAELTTALEEIAAQHDPLVVRPEQTEVNGICSAAAIDELLRATPLLPEINHRIVKPHRGWQKGRRLAVAALTIAALLWGFNGGTSLAVAHGWRAVGQPGSQPGTMYLVVDLSNGQLLNQQDISALSVMHAAAAISAQTATQNPNLVRQLAQAGLLIVNSAGGAPYRTGIFTGRSEIGSGASAIANITTSRPSLMLSNGDVDAIDVGLAALYGERIVIPQQTMTCSALVSLPRNGGVILVRITPSCGLSTALHTLAHQAAADNLRLTAL